MKVDFEKAEQSILSGQRHISDLERELENLSNAYKQYEIEFQDQISRRVREIVDRLTDSIVDAKKQLNIAYVILKEANDFITEKEERGL